MPRIKETISEILHPIRRNNLEARRRHLKLSRAALARILAVDPATVYRQERGVMSQLWDYALRGIEAEAKSKGAKAVVRDHQATVDRLDVIPDALAESGFGYTSEKMKAVKPRQKAAKPVPAPRDQMKGPRSRMPSRAAVTAAADRAEERSKKNGLR